MQNYCADVLCFILAALFAKTLQKYKVSLNDLSMIAHGSKARDGYL